MNKFFVILLILLLLAKKSFGQRETDMGFAFGTSYYMGDVNPSIPFYSPKMNLGFIYRYNLNLHHVIKFEANYLSVSGNDLDFNNQFQKERGWKFDKSLLDLSLQFEFNFMPLKFDVRKASITPFVSSGVAYAFILSSEKVWALPFTLGAKVSFGKNWTFGLGWNARKAFSDKIDNLENGQFNDLALDLLQTNRTIMNNNDWYYFANVFITYKIFDFRSECPAYMKSY